MTEKQRQFVREVGSVVLGVVIALGIGEAADTLRWTFRVENSLASMRHELSESHAHLVERLAYADCLDQRLAEIGTTLAAARDTGLLPEVRTVGRPGVRLFGTTAFEVVKSEGTPLHMDRAEARAIATAYAMTDKFRELAEQERQTWGTLQLLEGPGGPVSDGLLTALLQAWADARANAWVMKLVAQQGEELLVAVGAPLEYSDEVPDRAAIVERSLKNHSLCKPMLGDGVLPVANPDPP